jgi:ferredoxin--NADP+ reductase
MPINTTAITLPEVELNIRTPKNPVEVPVVENRICTAETSPNYVRHISFDISGTDLEGHILPGQAFGILPPGEDENGRSHKLRLYSMASPSQGEDGKSGLISTTVKRVIEERPEEGRLFMGVCSNYLCNLKPGDTVKLTGPSGKRFLLPEDPEEYNYVFFAAGTGIAPFRSMTMELLQQQQITSSQIALVFGCPYRTDVLYKELFDGFEQEYRNFNWLTKISREARRPDGSKYYANTAIEDDAQLLRPILSKSNTLIYICGLKGMELGIYRDLARQGFDDYLRLDEQHAQTDPNDWQFSEMPRSVKPGDRMFVEVY